MKPTLYPNGFPSAYEELKTFYPVFYRDVFEMDAIWRAAGGGLDEIEDGVDAILHDRIYQSCHHYLKLGYIDTSGLKNLEYLYKSYHALGGNGTGTELYNRAKALPIKDNDN